MGEMRQCDLLEKSGSFGEEKAACIPYNYVYLINSKMPSAFGKHLQTQRNNPLYNRSLAKDLPVIHARTTI